MDLPKIVMGLLNDSETEKTLVTVAADGKTSLTNIKSIKLPKPSVIVLAQVAAKQLNEELLAHMNKGRLVSILCVSKKEEQRTAFQIVCSVKEFQTSGPLYEKFLDELRARYLDLEGVWALEPVDIIDRSSNFDRGH
jgi:nickel-dependent lactate racemase